MENKTTTVGIIGLGYVGLPLAIVFAEAGFKVIGFDKNEFICNKLNLGESHIKDISNQRLLNVVSKSLFYPISNFEKLKECDIISICVPTPLNKIKDPDLSYVINASEIISKYLRSGQTIILESTTYPGTTKDLVLPILEKSKLKCGKDFYLCFSPERVDPGNKTWTTKNTPKILGGVTKKCTKAGIDVYSKIFDKVVQVQNTEAAELIKVYENTFRMVNIALANELSQICDKLDLDVWDIIDAASTKPFGFMKFTPGPGLGGHCIPLDPYYLSWKMRTLSFKTKLIELAGEINSFMPSYTVNKIGTKLNNNNKSFKDSKILLIGIAYKKDIDDLRESPALEIINLLQNNGSIVEYHDPFCPILEDGGHYAIKYLPLKSISLNSKKIKSFDICVIVTNHTNIDYDLIKNNATNIIDTRGVFRHLNEEL
jgi:UDP-N-acetyl-D-glucosamine dehydrogenase